VLAVVGYADRLLDNLVELLGSCGVRSAIVDLKEVACLPASPVPRELLDSADTLTGAFATLVERFPAFECLTIVDRNRHEERLSLARLWQRARDIQSAFLACGLEPGDFVQLALPTGSELVSAYVATMLAGGIPGLVATPVHRVADPRVYARRVGSILENAAARIFCCDAEVAELFRGDGGSLLGRATMVVPADLRAPAGAATVVQAQPGDIATVQYSSGSTGTPKGVLLTHRAMLNNIRAVRDGLGLTPRDVSVNWIPLYHDMGLIDAFLLPVLCGCPTVLIPTMDFMREPAIWPWALHRYLGTISWAPNFAYALCAKRVAERDLEGLDLSRWRIAINAAEPVLAQTIADFTHRFAVYGFRPEAMTPAWGLAENVTIATAHPVSHVPRVETIDRQALATENVARTTAGDGLPSVAIGRCLPHCELEIRDGDRRLPDRHVGAVWIRTDSLLARYHHDAERTARCLVDGWLDTGDRGYVADGDLFFVAREKDLLIVAGEKYAPHDVETVINRVPGVREGCSVAFGVSNSERGTEDIAAVVETREGDEQARERLRDRIRADVTRATGLALRWVLLVPPGGIEKTTSGKLARAATQRRYAEALRE
jgi:acyl-CoA synthetase (AMP-forming)/AMP-acid ligase II